MFKKSFQCYVDQTYPNRELVIVNEGSKEYQEQIRNHVSERDDVKLVFLNGVYSLGSLRNISIDLCNGELFVQWDDDDFCLPERLSVQYSYLSKHPTSMVCYLVDQLHYYFSTQQLFWNNWNKWHSGGSKIYSLIPGTIMAWKKGFDYRYPSSGEWCAAGEDSVLSNQLCLEQHDKVLLLKEMGHMHVYSFHGKNVWDIDHHMSISKQRSMPVDYLNQHRERICRTIDYLDLGETIKVTGRDGLAFMYGRKL